MENVIENGNYCVYIHTSPSGKKYVGMTGVGVEKRWGKDGSHYLKKEKNGEYMHQAFARAILKYGWENIEHEIVASNLTKEEANNFEKLLIEKLNTKNRQYGYNLKDGGSGGGGFSEETLKKMSESHKGIKQSKETIQKRTEKLKGKNNPNYGKKMNEEQKEKLKEARKLMVGEKHPMYGKHHSEETKKKLSEMFKERFANPENHPSYGRRASDESRRKMSESHQRKSVAMIDKDSGDILKVFRGIRDAEKEMGIARSGIINVCKGKPRYKTAGGYVWKYYEDIEITA